MGLQVYLEQADPKVLCCQDNVIWKLHESFFTTFVSGFSVNVHVKQSNVTFFCTNRSERILNSCSEAAHKNKSFYAVAHT